MLLSKLTDKRWIVKQFSILPKDTLTSLTVFYNLDKRHVFRQHELKEQSCSGSLLNWWKFHWSFMLLSFIVDCYFHGIVMNNDNSAVNKRGLLDADRTEEQLEVRNWSNFCGKTQESTTKPTYQAASHATGALRCVTHYQPRRFRSAARFFLQLSYCLFKYLASVERKSNIVSETKLPPRGRFGSDCEKTVVSMRAGHIEGSRGGSRSSLCTSSVTGLCRLDGNVCPAFSTRVSLPCHAKQVQP